MSFSALPMPEEPSHAHQGRVSLLFGIHGPGHFRRFVQQSLDSQSVEHQKMTPLEQLAAISSMQFPDYVRQHTLIGAARVAASSAELARAMHGSESTFEPNPRLLFRIPSTRFCSECAKEDLDHWGFSWFRRSHQVTGVDWCPTHRLPLLEVKATDPWSKLPHQWLTDGEFCLLKHSAPALLMSEFEGRFIELVGELLTRGKPFDAQLLGEVLVARARELDIRTSYKGSRPCARGQCVSDLVKAQAPSEWVSHYWPEISGTQKSTFICKVDKLSAYRLTRSGLSYITAMAAMWPSVTEVMKALKRIDGSLAPEEKRRPRQVCHSTQFWEGEAIRHYLKSRGNFGVMARTLGIHPTDARRRMKLLGLPSLVNVDSAASWRAFLRFQAGEPLAKACEAENVPIDKVEKLMRVAATPAARAARRVMQNSSRHSPLRLR